jgi:FKBP-type peptidyl-prolyl cis-trans isomerase
VVPPSFSPPACPQVICALHHLNEPNGSLPRTIAKCITAETNGSGWGGLRKALKRGVAKEYLLKRGEYYKVNETKVQAVAKQKRLEEEAKAGLERRLQDLAEGKKKTRKHGVEITVVTPGKASGEVARRGDTVIVKYKGTLQQERTQFDANSRFTFTLGDGDVIRGFDVGVDGMREGETRRLVIPPGMGYGKAGDPPTIPPRSTLCFDILLLKVMERG